MLDKVGLPLAMVKVFAFHDRDAIAVYNVLSAFRFLLLSPICLYQSPFCEGLCSKVIHIFVPDHCKNLTGYFKFF